MTQRQRVPVIDQGREIQQLRADVSQVWVVLPRGLLRRRKVTQAAKPHRTRYVEDLPARSG
jgi:hypothetical protein